MKKKLFCLLFLVCLLTGSLSISVWAMETGSLGNQDSDRTNDSLSVSATAATNLVYNRFSKDLVSNPIVMDGTLDVTDQFDITYTVNGGDASSTAKAKDAGSYTVVVIATAKLDSDYAGANLSAAYNVDIAPEPLKNLYVKYLEGREQLDYTGQPQELLESTIEDSMNKKGQMFVVMNSGMQLSHNSNPENTEISVYFEMSGVKYPFDAFMTFPEATEEGKYVIHMYADAISPNFTGSRVLITSFVIYIGPKFVSELPVVLSEVQERSYNGKAQTLLKNATVIKDGDKDVTDSFNVTYTLKKGSTVLVDAASDYKKMVATDAGEYAVEITYSAKNTDKYTEDVITKTRYVTIKPKEAINLSTIMSTAKSYTYSGEAYLLLENAATIKDGDKDVSEFFDITYTLEQGTDVLVDAVSDYTEIIATDAGDYWVVINYMAKEDTNYIYGVECSMNVSIAKRAVILTPANGQTKIYGQSAENVESAIAENYTVEVAENVLDVETLKAELISKGIVFERMAGENAANYPIVLTADAQAQADALKNYQVTVGDAFFVITPAPLTVSVSEGQTKTYGTEDPVFEYTISEGELYWNDELSGAIAREEGADVGEYAYRQGTLANDNYDITVVAADKFVITPATPDLGIVTGEIADNETDAAEIVLNRTDTSVAGILYVTEPSATLLLGENEVAYTFVPDDSKNYTEVTGTVQVVATDTVGPTGEVTMSENRWKEFLNTITFDRFFKETVCVVVTADDAFSGVSKVEYIERENALSLEEVKSIETWTDMMVDANGRAKVLVTAADAKSFVYYIRITDKVGNTTYLSTDGALFDTQAPVVKGITEGAIYYTTQKFTIEEIHPGVVTVNGTEVTEYTLDGNVEMVYEVVVTDAVGNITAVKVYMKPISMLTESIKQLTEENVTCEDEEKISAVEKELEALDITNAADEEKALITAAFEKIDALQKKIEVIKRAEDEALKAQTNQTATKDTADTGDHTNAAAGLSLMLISAISVFLLAGSKKRAKYKE